MPNSDGASRLGFSAFREKPVGVMVKGPPAPARRGLTNCTNGAMRNKQYRALPIDVARVLSG